MLKLSCSLADPSRSFGGQFCCDAQRRGPRGQFAWDGVTSSHSWAA